MHGSKIEATYPLSPMQQGMLFHSVYERGFYIQQMVCSLREDVNVSVLRRAWQRVIERHAILRTSFCYGADKAFQEVHERVTVEFEEEDWRGKSEQEQTEKEGEYSESESQRGLELN